MQLRFTVRGTPQSKGSRVQIRPRCNIEAGTKVSRARKKAWASAVEASAIEARLTSAIDERYPISSPVSVDVALYLPIPKSRLKGVRRIVAGGCHTSKPDVDKLARAILDPLTEAGVVKDDCVIAELVATKSWCLPGEERAEIAITWLT